MSDAFDPQQLADKLQLTAQRRGLAAATGWQAFLRLLVMAETHNYGQAQRVARFIAATHNSKAFAFDLHALPSADEALCDDIDVDMLLCLDALRGGQADLHSLLPDGDWRVRALIDQLGLMWPNAS